jgi:hypothetical protein
VRISCGVHTFASSSLLVQGSKNVNLPFACFCRTAKSCFVKAAEQKEVFLQRPGIFVKKDRVVRKKCFETLNLILLNECSPNPGYFLFQRVRYAPCLGCPMGKKYATTTQPLTGPQRQFDVKNLIYTQKFMRKKGARG